MKIQTLSFVIGGKACNAKCPFCISRLTGFSDMEAKIEPKWDNLDATLKFAEASGVTTALLTGKGEPLLYPEQIRETLYHLERSNIAFKELQTNGLLVQTEATQKYLRVFYSQGLRTVSLSVVHFQDELNSGIYTPGKPYPPLVETIRILHDIGFSVRLSVIMLKGYIDSANAFESMIQFAKMNNVEQLTLRCVSTPENAQDTAASLYVSNHLISLDSLSYIQSYLHHAGTKLLSLAHGAVVYDVKGQNVCLSTCLTESSNPEDIRQIIYFLSDGSLRYSWQYNGARLL